jgi:uncharacterized RDD family membrane protein YckC
MSTAATVARASGRPGAGGCGRYGGRSVQVATARLVTPEAVVLQFETAGLGSRFLATLLDLAIQGSVLFLTAIASTVLASTGDGSAVAATVGLLLVVAGILLGYPVAFETL